MKNNPWILLAQSEEGASDLDDGLLEDKNNDRGYNTFWIDPGVDFATVKGETPHLMDRRSADGRVPVSPAGQKARADAQSKKRATMYRRAGDAADRGTLPHRLHRRRRARDAQHDLQQQLPDRADEGSRDHRGRDGARRPHRSDREQQGRGKAQAQRDQAVARRFRRLVGRRHAGGRDVERPSRAGAARARSSCRRRAR